MKLKYKYVAVDFDGTIAYDEYPGIGDLIPGAKETMQRIKELGGEIAIWTCRTGEAASNAENFLIDNNIPYDYFNKPFSHNVNEYGGDYSRKIFASIYIDDRCVLWNGNPVNWFIIQNLIFEED
jgi:ribonucleotide monophosphatase NagD (HAD superfamily)